MNGNESKKEYSVIHIECDEIKVLFEKEIELLRTENKNIKAYINKLRNEAHEKYGNNTGVLIFIQKLQESFTWINNVRSF